MRYDESYSAIAFVAAGKWFDYHEPNNHILNTLLMQLCVWMGGFSVAMLRLPAFLCGVLMIPAAGWAAFVMSGRKSAAILAAGFVAASSILVEYSTNARGYSLVSLAGLVMLALSIRLVQKPGAVKLWLAWGVAAIAGLYAVPTMLQTVALVSGLMLIAGGRSKLQKLAPRLGAALICAGAITICLYLPVIRGNGLAALVANRWVAPVPAGTLPGAFAELFRNLRDDWSRDNSWLALGMLATGVAAAFAGGVRRRDPFWCVPVFAMIVMILFAVLGRHVPPARAVLYILPLIFTSAAVGLVYCCDFARSARGRAVSAGCLLFLACLAWGGNARTMERRDYMISEYAATCVDAEAVARFMAGHGLYNGEVATLPSLEVSAPFLFYTYLHAPAEIHRQPALTDPRCRQYYLLLRRPETAPAVYENTPHLKELFGEPQLVRTFPTASVFVCQRR